jgi:hypothetical protein
MKRRTIRKGLKLPRLSKQQKIWIGVGVGVLAAVVVFGKKRISPALLEINWLNDPTIYRRGLKNNNPGNIILTNEPWEGKIPKEQNTDGKFEQFKTYAYGVRAMIVLLKNYMKSLNTIEGIILRWNPGNPNYVRYVSDRMATAANAPLTANKQTIKALVQAIADFENGIKSGEFPAVSDDMFEAAWSIV